MRILAEALTYDDVFLVPAHSIVLPRDVDTSTRLTRTLRDRDEVVHDVSAAHHPLRDGGMFD